MRKNPFSKKALLAERNAARREVVISGPTVVPFTSKVWKMSRTSMSVDTVCTLVIGDAVTAKSPGYREILCTVARAAKEHARLRFAKALTDADVLEWVPRSRGRGSRKGCWDCVA